VKTEPYDKYMDDRCTTDITLPIAKLDEVVKEAKKYCKE